MFTLPYRLFVWTTLTDGFWTTHLDVWSDS